MSVLGIPLAAWQGIVIYSLLATAIIVGFIHWAIVARISRSRQGSSFPDRLLPFGFGLWHLGVLRRSWYPASALPQRRWVVLTYAVSLGCVIAAFGLLMSWAVF
jgi:hypothetical protein